MVMVTAYSFAQSGQYSVGSDDPRSPQRRTTTPLFGQPGERNNRQLPQAFMSTRAPGRNSRAHFHVLDQFQVVVHGGLKVGRHAMTASGVHFARAYTPYGPLVMDAESGMTQLVLRPYHDPMGPLRIPDEQAMLQSMPDRAPWQTFIPHAAFPRLQAGGHGPNAVLEAIPGMSNDQGLAAYTLSMGHDAKLLAPDPAHGDGQYVAVLDGSLIYENTEYEAVALVFVAPREAPFEIHAGSLGLKALVLNFPRGHDSARREHHSNAWACSMCAYVYDQLRGEPHDGIGAGTEWHNLPQDWTCPSCSSPKALFVQV